MSYMSDETKAKHIAVLKAGVKTLRAIEMRGGEIVETKRGETTDYAAFDAFGRPVERFDADAVARLRAAGRLRMRRFERGGVVWALAPSAMARAAYYEPQ